MTIPVNTHALALSLGCVLDEGPNGTVWVWDCLFPHEEGDDPMGRAVPTANMWDAFSTSPNAPVSGHLGFCSTLNVAIMDIVATWPDGDDDEPESLAVPKPTE